MVTTCRGCLLLLVVASAVDAQQLNPSKFVLPSLNRPLTKPQISQDLMNYFQLTGSAKQFVDNFLGRPGPVQYIPDPAFEVAGSHGQQPPLTDARSLLNLPKIPGLNGPLKLPPGFRNGFSLVSGNQGTPQLPSVAASISKQPQTLNAEAKTNQGTTDNGGSSIKGIPSFFPKLPPAPIPQVNVAPRIPQASGNLAIPSIPTRPDVPNGGLGLLAGQSQLPAAGGVRQAVQQPAPLQGNFQPQQFVAPGSYVNPGAVGANGRQTGILDPLLDLLGLKQYAGRFRQLNTLFNQAGVGPATVAGAAPGGADQQGVLGSLIYSALTNNAIQRQGAGNETNADGKNASSIGFSKEQAALLGSNVALIQQLLTQPDSPLCTSKPVPMQQFNLDSFMGTWYQTLHSPPLSPGPCSMVAYKKLADVGNGGPGTVFDTFEYTTEGTPFGRPTISSGYAIVRAPGELIYRTTSSPNDINVNVIETGPLNAQAQYEYVVLSVNCNYPLYVYARDPVVYKRKYEGQVNAFLEQKGITNGFSRLLNIVAPVDSTLCNFPPTLFNIRG